MGCPRNSGCVEFDKMGRERQRGVMSVLIRTVVLLGISNVFMTFAWYAHLRNLNDKKWYIAALLSWGLALFEYLFQVPANRIGHSQVQLGTVEDSPRDYHACCVRPIRPFLHAPAS